MPLPFQTSKDSTGYYGAQGGIMPVLSFGAQALAHSFLTTGSHMGFWTAIVIHVAALTLNITANSLFFASDGATDTNDLMWGWAISSLIGHTLAVIGVLAHVGFVKVQDTTTTQLFVCTVN